VTDIPLYGLLALAVVALDAWALVQIVRSPAQAAGKAVWALAVLLLPVLGVVLRTVMGNATARAKP
jgi:hypothetical protein